MIFAAGVGSRMKPLTDSTPKALIEAGGKRLLEWHIAKMIRYGVKDIIINVHHLAAQITRFLGQNRNFGINIAVSDETEHLLDTGGGLFKASWFFSDESPFLVVNSDILSDIDYSALLDQHTHAGSLATLAVRNRSTSRYFLFDEKRLLCGWENITTHEKKIIRPLDDPERLAFSGIQVINPLIFKLIDRQGKFSLVDLYLELASGYEIKAYLHDQDFWMDIGRPESLREFNEIASKVKNL